MSVVTLGSVKKLLGQLIFVNKSNVARQLAVLEEKGYVRRQTSSLDGRRQLIYPTEKALAMQPILQKLLKQWNEQVLEGFSEAEQQKIAGRSTTSKRKLTACFKERR